MNILFVNGSPNRNGNTALLAKMLLKDTPFETLQLTDYKIYAYGQQFPDDQFNAVIKKMKEADILVIGSPLYWHNICGSVRNLLDRSYGAIDENTFAGKDMYFILQGAAPTAEQLAASAYTMQRYAALYGMRYKGMITNEKEAKRITVEGATV